MKITFLLPTDYQILKDFFIILTAAIIVFAIFPPPWPIMFGVGIAGCLILQILYELFPGDLEEKKEDCQHENGYIASADLDPRSTCRDCGARIEWTTFSPRVKEKS